MFLRTLILRMPRKTTKKTLRPFLGDRLSYGIHIPFIPFIRWFKNPGIIRIRRSLGLPKSIHLFLHGLGTHEIQRRHIGALIQGQRSPFLVVLMTLDSVFLSEFHLAEKVQSEVGEFNSSRPVLLIVNFIREAVMVDQSVQESFSGMTISNPLSHVTAQVNEILQKIGELTYQTVLRNC